MTFSLLAVAPAVIQIHAIAAMTAVVSGFTVMIMRKGTVGHRGFGWVFVVAMTVVALSSLFITRDGSFSAIHILSLITIVGLPLAILARRRGNIGRHRRVMTFLFAGLVVAGLFTLAPGRLMHSIVLDSVLLGR